MPPPLVYICIHPVVSYGNNMMHLREHCSPCMYVEDGYYLNQFLFKIFFFFSRSLIPASNCNQSLTNLRSVPPMTNERLENRSISVAFILICSDSQNFRFCKGGAPSLRTVFLVIAHGQDGQDGQDGQEKKKPIVLYTRAGLAPRGARTPQVRSRNY